MRLQGTYWGSKLSHEDQRLVNELRNRFNPRQIPIRYDTDFNFYRWILNADRSSKIHGNLDLAERNLRNHFRYRQALRLDTEPVPSWEENPIHQCRLLPKGVIKGRDCYNRLLWYTEFRSIDMQGLMHKFRSSEMLIYHFWLYEELLRMVNEHESRTGVLSALHFVVSMAGYDMNPFGMLFVTSGSMGYYTHLFHYEHYPELVYPMDILNVAKWMTIPYRMIKSIMPYGFSDRFRVHDTHFMPALQQEINITDIPVWLSGKRKGVDVCHALKVLPEDYWQGSESDPPPEALHHLTVGARRRKFITVEIHRPNTKLSWYFTTDAELHFGVFLHVPKRDTELKHNIDDMDMVEPWFRLAGRLVPEENSLICERPGLYYLVFCNKTSWITKKHVRIQLEMETAPQNYRLLQRTFSI